MLRFEMVDRKLRGNPERRFIDVVKGDMKLE